MGKRVSHTIMMLLLVVLLLLIVSPFILVVINVFKSKSDIISNTLSLIGRDGFILDNFPDDMEKMNF